MGLVGPNVAVSYTRAACVSPSHSVGSAGLLTVVWFISRPVTPEYALVIVCEPKPMACTPPESSRRLALLNGYTAAPWTWRCTSLRTSVSRRIPDSPVVPRLVVEPLNHGTWLVNAPQFQRER